MKDIQKFNREHKKKLAISILFLCVSVLISGLLLFLIYSSKLKQIIKEEAKIALENVSSQNIINLTSTISDKKNLLIELAKIIEGNKNFNIDNIIEELKLYSKTNRFYNMGIIDKHGIGHTTLGEKLDLSEYDYFINGMNGFSEITSGHISEDGKGILN
ncbi:hypothetical protein H9X78_13985, partial [Clostridium saudiense]|nr:hypothetical protein [Clostridium saudiense]